MVNYINLAFDYDAVSKQDGVPYISNDVVSPWGTGRIELLDDLFFYKHGCCVSAIVGSRNNHDSLFFGNGDFSIQRTSNHLEKTFYKDFGMARTMEECQIIWQSYNDKLFDFALKSLDKLSKYRKNLGLSPIVYDFVHTPSSWLTFGAAKKLSEYFKLPLVSSIHVDEIQIQSLKGNIYPWSDFILEKDKITKIESDSLIIKNKLLYDQAHLLNNNCIVIGNDLNFPIYNSKILKEKNYKKILYVGRVSYEKGFDKFAQIVQHINSKSNDYTFVICGEIWDDGRVSDLVRTLKSYKNVFFHGRVGRSSIQDVFLDSGTFILPSRTETYNQTIMEALFYGCNVICTDVGAAKQQVGDCENAYILPNDNNFVESSLKLLEEMKYNYEQSLVSYNYANEKFNKNLFRQKKLDYLTTFFGKK